LRWYPPSWRERYGAEFVDLMEQEMADSPRSRARAINIIYKGTVTRLRDVSVVGFTANPSEQSRAAVATAFVLSALFMALAINFWSIAMLSWNAAGNSPASVAVTLWTGAVTVLAALLTVLVFTTLVTLLASAVKRIMKGQAKGVVGPLLLIVSSVVYLVFSIRGVLRFVMSRNGIDWSHPGQAVKQFAGSSNALTYTINRIWMSPRESLKLSPNYFYALIPFVLLALALAVATLIRRTDFSISATRFGRVVLVLLASTMILFIVCYLGLISASFQDLGRGLNEPLSSALLLIEFGLMALIAGLSAQTALRVLRKRDVVSTTTRQKSLIR
jgi:hypothetical protein